MPLTCLVRLLGLNKALTTLCALLEGVKNQPTLNVFARTSQKFKSYQSFKIKGLKDKLRTLNVINDYSNQLFIHSTDVIKRAPKKKMLVIPHKQGIIKVILKDVGWKKLCHPESLPTGARARKGYVAYYHERTQALLYIAERIAVRA